MFNNNNTRAFCGFCLCIVKIYVSKPSKIHKIQGLVNYCVVRCEEYAIEDFSGDYGHKCKIQKWKITVFLCIYTVLNKLITPVV